MDEVEDPLGCLWASIMPRGVKPGVALQGPMIVGHLTLITLNTTTKK